jgi:hypothetical protein
MSNQTKMQTALQESNELMEKLAAELTEKSKALIDDLDTKTTTYVIYNKETVRAMIPEGVFTIEDFFDPPNKVVECEDLCLADLFGQEPDAVIEALKGITRQILVKINVLISSEPPLNAGSPEAVTVQWLNIKDEENNPDQIAGYFRIVVTYAKPQTL